MAPSTAPEAASSNPGRIAVVPATADRFDDVARVLNPNGREQACWCMHWRAPAKEDVTTRGERLRDLTGQEPAPGMLAYLGPGSGTGSGTGSGLGAGSGGAGSEPGSSPGENPEVAGWLGFSRRSAAQSLQRSRVLPTGEPETWPTTWVFMCVTVRAGFRRQGVARALLDAGVAYAAEHGATALDAFPVEPEAGRRVPVSAAFVGTVAMFERAGFDRLAPTDATSGRLTRWHMRRELTAA
ncbi:GNAT family N-acetyltransferase [Promicromonospora sukumoe]|uniref:GNAT superfamily N-acetyltransferase n=1 Tax=Promicromonospora sukumoe TaxID=88382 RepID=A0A7W3J796_9MICO|nr:GNAT family N-acetyltransferase [Promicromonospora sukumoe]MBA8807454.1 GNAT superfamily N-acetyltransferase [Promicromonospora sukumoe]